MLCVAAVIEVKSPQVKGLWRLPDAGRPWKPPHTVSRSGTLTEDL